MVAISKILEASHEIVKVSPGTYDASINVFENDGLFKRFNLAISIALSHDSYGAYELVSNLRTLKSFNRIDINKSMVTFVMNNMEGVIKKGRSYFSHCDDAEIISYNKIINSFLDGEKDKVEVAYEAESLLGKLKAEEYVFSDFRLEDSYFNSNNSSVMSTHDNAIGSILSSFDI